MKPQLNEFPEEVLHACILCQSTKIEKVSQKLPYSRCRQCHHLFLNPRPNIVAISAFYSQKGKYDQWISEKSKAKLSHKDRATFMKRLKKKGALLDIGAGFGQFLSLVKDHYDVTGTEISDEGVCKAKELYNLNLIQGELDTIDFGQKKFDVITMSQVLEHLQNPGRVIERCYSLLNPGGFLYISVPNEAVYSLRRLLPGLLSMFGFAQFQDFTPTGLRKFDLSKMSEIHLSFFSPPVLERRLLQAGFSFEQKGLDFIDMFMLRGTFYQVLRYLCYFPSVAVMFLTKSYLLTYNSFWILVRK